MDSIRISHTLPKTCRYNSNSGASTSDYLVASSTTAALLTFNNPGVYDVSLRVSDDRDAWSDWTAKTVTVKENNGEIIKPDCPDWEDTYISYHRIPFSSDRTVYMSKLSDVSVNSSGIKLKNYTNWNGSYDYVIAYEIAPETLFACSERRYVNGTSGGGNLDPMFSQSTPRRLTSIEIGILRKNEPNNGVPLISVIYDSKTGTIIDFCSRLNPIIFHECSTPTYIIADK